MNKKTGMPIPGRRAGLGLALATLLLPSLAGADVKVLAANDLGMHCADLDYQVFSILPPFNVLHAQVIERGVNGNPPRILTDGEARVFYRAGKSHNDPAGADSINTSSIATEAGVPKTNFWDANTLTGNSWAFDTYARLYPFDTALGNSILSLFEPLPKNTGLPVPDLNELLAGNLVPYQQKMPGPNNRARPFSRFDRDLPFFAGLKVQGQTLGKVIQNVNWFAADGIPILPVDDQGRSNPYPLVRVLARDTATNSVLGGVSVVLPVASEADCQTCHGAAEDGFSGIAADFASVNTDASPGNDFEVMTEADAQAAGLAPEFLLNAAKMNILRLHDANHRTNLEGSRPVQCSQCHYSPALDLAQVGPVDEPAAGPSGRQQTTHISMSRAMHDFHGRQRFGGKKVFPNMPPPVAADGTPRSLTRTQNVLQKTCYQCHPGKKAQCLRGAMAAGGVVCQDCHGDMQQVGNDFSGDLTASNPSPTGLNLEKRIPWASEPACQSCHTGDALNSNHPADAVVADDGIRLLKAFQEVVLSDNTVAAQPHRSPASRFAENEPLYRLSTGHGGVMCEGCHGSTHAIFPNPVGRANDNVASKQLQGHTGTILECTTCHEAGSLGVTLGGPHGMHPVADSRWIRGHEGLVERQGTNSCKSCHGADGLGTVLSRTPVARTVSWTDDGRTRTRTFGKGTPIACNSCHENKINGD